MKIPHPELPQDPQRALPFYGKTIDVDGRHDLDGLVTYYGKATHVFDRTYRCLARVGDVLCIVEITVGTPESSSRS